MKSKEIYTNGSQIIKIEGQHGNMYNIYTLESVYYDAAYNNIPDKTISSDGKYLVSFISQVQ